MIVRVVIEDFFYSIIRERLEVNVNGVEISAATVHALVDDYPPETVGISGHEPLSKSYLSFVSECVDLPSTERKEALSQWDGNGPISEDMFAVDDLEELKARFTTGQIIHVRLPMQVRRKSEPAQDTHVDIYLRSSDEIEKTEEAFIRRDLYIAKEKKLKGTFGKTHCLVIADDEPISEFLANAEVASHLNWNAQEERVVERFQAVGPTLRAVRQSAKRLLELLQGGDAELAEDLLVDILSIPLDESETKKSKKAGGAGKKVVVKKKPGAEISSNPKYHQIVDGSGVRLQNGSDQIPTGQLPVQGRLELAYHNVAFRGDPFSHYHPFDFDLSDTTSYPVKSSGLNVLKQDENVIEFEVTNPTFLIEVSGFDPHKPIRARAILEI